MADRVSAWFVGVVLVLAGATMLLWWRSGPHTAIEHAVALLIITCPCALGLATPLAVVVAIGRAAGRGILIKGGEALEALARRGTIVFDKTGTLTRGELRVQEYHGPPALRALIAQAEAGSSHPIAGALARHLAPPGARLPTVEAGSFESFLGGGVRARADVMRLLDAGVSRVVVGSAAVKTPDQVAQWIAEFSAEKICCAFDVAASGGERYEVRVEGWMKGSGVSLEAALQALAGRGLRHALITDIARDGVLAGPNLALTQSVRRRFPDLALQASGGVSSLDDLATLKSAGAAGAIVGRALYEKKFTLEDALGR